jgi:uncharacterized repeat protein (TIGR04138 family)
MAGPGLDWKSVYAALHRAGEATFPPAALHYVLQRVRLQEGVPPTAPDETRSSPVALVAAFRRAVRIDFGPMAGDVLTEWHLECPADLGRAVLLLGKYRCLTLEPSDTLEAFAADEQPFHEGFVK